MQVEVATNFVNVLIFVLWHDFGPTAKIYRIVTVTSVIKRIYTYITQALYVFTHGCPIVIVLILLSKYF